VPQHWDYDGPATIATADPSSKVPQSLQVHEDIMDIDNDKATSWRERAKVGFW
jgi:hypothetical protein